MGLKVDYTKLTDQVFELIQEMPEEYQSALSLGMLPAPIMDMVERNFEEEVKNIIYKQYGLDEDPEEDEELLQIFAEEAKLKAKVYSKVFMKEITIRLLNKAKEHNILLV